MTQNHISMIWGDDDDTGACLDFVVEHKLPVKPSLEGVQRNWMNRALDSVERYSHDVQQSAKDALNVAAAAEARVRYRKEISDLLREIVQYEKTYEVSLSDFKMSLIESLNAKNRQEQVNMTKAVEEVSSFSFLQSVIREELQNLLKKIFRAKR